MNALEEFKSLSEMIMSGVSDNSKIKEAIIATQEMYRLKAYYFPMIDASDLEPLIYSDYCPLCKRCYGKISNIYKCKGCPINLGAPCCSEWGDLFIEATEVYFNRRNFNKAFNKLAEKIFSL